MKFFNDIYKFFSYLSFIDIIFLVAIVVLLILIVTLIYFIKINNEPLGEDDLFLYGEADEGNAEVLEYSKECEVPNKEDNLEVVKEYDDEEGELLDLESLTNKLKEDAANDRIQFTSYEKDQEEKAIISYDELLKKHNKYAVNYEKEEVHDDLVVKKVDLNDLENKNIEENIEDKVRVISYQKEEEFLKALKELNSLLN